MEERLYPIPGYEGLYSITKSGKVLSHRNWNGHGDRWMIPSGDSGGSVILTKDGKTVHRGVNSLLRETFNERPNDMRPIPDTNNMYWISLEGAVWSEYSHSVLKPTISSTGATICSIKYTYGRKPTDTRTMAAKVFEDKLPPNGFNKWNRRKIRDYYRWKSVFLCIKKVLKTDSRRHIPIFGSKSMC